MTMITLDARGLKCPQPTLKLTGLTLKTPPGEIVEVIADCPTFEKDVREWASRWEKVVLWLRDEGDTRRCQIQF